MDSLDRLMEVFVAVPFTTRVFVGLGFVVFLILFFRSILSIRREEQESWVDRAAQWRELCRRITDVVENHATGRLTVELLEFNPFGGEILVTWDFGGNSEKVLSVHFPSEDHPIDKTRLMVRRGRTEKMTVLGIFPNEFDDFVSRFEKIINDYTSPLSEGGDKSIKL